MSHLKEVKESYLYHMKSAWLIAGRCFISGIAAFVHGLIPLILKDTASRHIRAMVKELENRNRW